MKKFIWPILIILASCLNQGSNDSDSILARVHNDYLYESELIDVVPKGLNVKDSISIVQNYINNWIRQKLYLKKAEANLLDEDKQFKKQLEDYKNSLILYTYESKLVSQNIDTIVSQQDIEYYYNENKENFQLNNNIVKAYYARFDKEHEKIRRIKWFFYSDSPEHRDSLEVYVEHYADLYYLDDETWILFDDLLKYVPISTYNQEAYLQNHRKIEIVDELDIYFVNFTDFKMKEGVSPLSFENETIRQIILNQRKLNIIKQMRQEVFESAMQNNEFEIY